MRRSRSSTSASRPTEERPRLKAKLLQASKRALWALALVNRSLPAVTTSLGLLATPAVGIASGAAFPGEALDPSLVAALALIAGGIAFGIIGDRQPSGATAAARQ